MTGRGRSRGMTDPYTHERQHPNRDHRQAPVTVVPIPSSSRDYEDSTGRGRSRTEPQPTQQPPPYDLLFTEGFAEHIFAQRQYPERLAQPIASGNFGAVKAECAVKAERAAKIKSFVKVEDSVKLADAGNEKRPSPTELTNIIRTKPQNVQSKKGTWGQPVTLLTNHFRLLKPPNWQLYQYHVNFSPPIELRGLRNRLIFEQKSLLGGYLFDGTSLFLSVKLPHQVTQFTSSDRDGKSIRTTVEFTRPIDMTTTVSAQILNLILRRSMAVLHLQLIGRNFFDAMAKIDIPQHHLQLWPGYVTTIRQYETDIMLCAEVTNKVMRTDTVHDILLNCVQNERMNYKSAFKMAVVGMTVLTVYNNRTYYIDDVDFNSWPTDTFPTQRGDVTFMEYYRNKYRLTIRNTRQPLLVAKLDERYRGSGRFENILLVPELCRVTGLTDDMRNDHRLMSAVAIHTKLAPNVRIERLNAFNRRLRSADEFEHNFTDWNLVLDKNMVRVVGRQLATEKILFADQKITLSNHEANWSREFRDISMFTSQHLRNWLVIVPQCKRREAEDFISVLQRAGNGMRYEVRRPTIIAIPDDRGQTYSTALDQAFCGDPQLIMCIVLNTNADKYGLIKKKCCLERAIPSQVIVVKRITPQPGRDRGSQLSVATKVIVQINSKLGGAPWMIEIPISGLMVVGFNVCRDTIDNRTSYGALVASMDMKCSQTYFSAIAPHTTVEEMYKQLALNMGRALICFTERHNSLPDRIVFYREGVGERRTNSVLEHEVNVIRDKLEKFYGDDAKRLKFTFIIVSKRTTARFFKGGVNPTPGTVVDDVVTLPERYDFFLNSQFVRNGTVTPTNYNVIHDTSGWPPDRLQVLSYKMTHLYYNWSGTLAVPAVCQYAHKLAYLVCNFIHQPPSNLLEKQLYFL
ncbi:protein aubergine-like [Bradysia coprophila]|uniref:protein aubergine-like n=1 Tax=Bradysia coprophila TaxID=38358 RepID=UPI00187DBDB9|nr:protein aubergine-like [Bradysia coprophila]